MPQPVHPSNQSHLSRIETGDRFVVLARGSTSVGELNAQLHSVTSRNVVVISQGTPCERFRRA